MGDTIDIRETDNEKIWQLGGGNRFCRVELSFIS